jgi:hypothetical protein
MKYNIYCAKHAYLGGSLETLISRRNLVDNEFVQMIWDRDYMKQQNGDGEVAEDAEASSPGPEPFNLFAGIQPEPLSPSSDSSAVKPVVTQVNQPSTPAMGADPSSARGPWLYVTIAIIALVVGLVLSSQFWN